jgi:hypothetical protein
MTSSGSIAELASPRTAATPPCAKSIGVVQSSAKRCDEACKRSRTSSSKRSKRRQPKEKNGLTTDRKIKANRANAQASTGPQTAQGRARTAKNALRHALSLPVCSNPALSEEVETLAREIAGPGANAQIQELACQAAEAEIDLRRVRYARYQLLSRALADPYYYEPRATTRKKAALLRFLLRKNAPDVPMANVLKFVTSTPQGPDKLATILS